MINNEEVEGRASHTHTGRERDRERWGGRGVNSTWAVTAAKEADRQTDSKSPADLPSLPY